ncbi:unnamed protein product [Paramecium octaurelia]|uniref:Uncharacterized protein n=1 Tax=Paramecium octaurelia TaxID=43137 RepID=A0A8S1W792_PAROT|nr:unnamed protein product [Paramecium octaurelia]
MSTIQELITTLFNLIVGDDDVQPRNRFLKTNSPIEQLRIIIEMVIQQQHQKQQQDYKALEKQLQKFEFEVRNHIRDEYLMQQNQEDLISRLEEMEKEKNELFSNTKQTIIKLKRENEELYQKVRLLSVENQQQKSLNEKLTTYQERHKMNDHLTQESTKISQSKYSTLENHNQKIIKLKTHPTPKKLHTETSVDISLIAAVNQKRLSQQLIKPNYFQKKGSITNNQFIKKKRQSCSFANQSLNFLTTSM